MRSKMRALALGVLAAALLMGCGTSTGQVGESLEAKLTQYKKCYTQKDSICLSTMVLPSVVEEVGGVQEFVQLMESVPALLAQQGFTMDAAKMEFGESGPIVSHEEYLVSVVPTRQPVVVQGQEGVIESSIVAFSGDNGETWFFLEGTDESKFAIANDSPQLLQKVDIPAPKLTLGDRTLVQRNGQWTQE